MVCEAPARSIASELTQGRSDEVLFFGKFPNFSQIATLLLRLIPLQSAPQTRRCRSTWFGSRGRTRSSISASRSWTRSPSSSAQFCRAVPVGPRRGAVYCIPGDTTRSALRNGVYDVNCILPGGLGREASGVLRRGLRAFVHEALRGETSRAGRGDPGRYRASARAGGRRAADSAECRTGSCKAAMN